MNEERNVSEPIVVFNKNVRTSELNELFKEFQGDIIVNGNLILNEKKLVIKCDNLYVTGGISMSINNTDVCVIGNLYVGDDIDCCNINVNGSICCTGCISSLEIDIAEDLYCENGIDTCGYDMNVGGEVVCNDDIAAAEIVVLKKIYVKSTIEADSISVG